MWAINWGDAPTWLAAVFAALAGVIAYRLYQVESKRDQKADDLQAKRDEEALKWQASVCAAWYDTEDHQIEDGALVPVWGVRVVNGSPVPIRQVEVILFRVKPHDDLRVVLTARPSWWMTVGEAATYAKEPGTRGTTRRRLPRIGSVPSGGGASGCCRRASTSSPSRPTARTSLTMKTAST
jgi:hypothetical protein